MTIKVEKEHREWLGFKRNTSSRILEHRSIEDDKNSLIEVARNRIVLETKEGKKEIVAISEDEIGLKSEHGSQVLFGDNINERNLVSANGKLRVVWAQTQDGDYPIRPMGRKNARFIKQKP